MPQEATLDVVGAIMLTRLEVNGFKNLVDFALDFGPMTCLAGPSGVGKSNILDAIRFLALLTQYPVNAAALQISDDGSQIGNVVDLFSYAGNRRVPRMEFAVEMIVDRQVRDDAGREAEASSSFLRYEVVFRHQPASPGTGPTDSLVLEREELVPITEGRAGRHLRFPHSKNRFRDSVVYNNRHARTGYVSTRIDPVSRQPVVSVHQDGRGHGRVGPSPAVEASRTTLGLENTVATPTILAAKREMRSWKVMALDPVAMRQPDRFIQSPGIGADGSHIPATLRQLTNTAGQVGEGSDAITSAIIRLVSEIVPVKNVDVVEDDVRQLLSLEIEEPSGLRLRGSGIPDTALRFLALAVLTKVHGNSAICLKEPETGLHPGKLPDVNHLLRMLAVDAAQPVGTDNPLRQVIVTTHSPFLAQLQREDDLLLAKTRSAEGSGGEPPDHLLECVPCAGTWRCVDGQEGISLLLLQAHLMPPDSAQIAFPKRFWA